MTIEQFDEEAWCAEQRAQVQEYLDRQEGLRHGAVGDWPAWHAAPHLSIWAIESVSSPGSVGWWALTGDVPTDYCSASDCGHPRFALQRIAERWLHAIDTTAKDETIINGTGLSVELAPLLRRRADTMLEFAADDEIWAE